VGGRSRRIEVPRPGLDKNTRPYAKNADSKKDFYRYVWANFPN
jgi:hypothetical protein